MSDTALQLLDRVLPEAPVRQWVLSVPRRIRYLLARDAGLLSGALRIFVGETFVCCVDELLPSLAAQRSRR